MKIYSTKEVADKLKIHKRTVLNEINRDNLKAKMIGNKFRITEKALKNYLDDTEDNNQTKQPEKPEKKHKPKKGVEYTTTKEASRRLDKSTRTIQRYVKQGKLEGYKDGKEWKISRRSIEEYQEGEENV